MVEIRKKKPNLEFISKIEKTRELCGIIFPEYIRFESDIDEIFDYFQTGYSGHEKKNLYKLL